VDRGTDRRVSGTQDDEPAHRLPIRIDCAAQSCKQRRYLLRLVEDNAGLERSIFALSGSAAPIPIFQEATRWHRC
jgi:hypothetical protein